ncbi:MAG: D-alanine--D-alanine ligase [Gammaproteobacteria bacterium]|nr:D-alanine--D-alanine ligase [Gammaproteobacteria bacterium]
MRKRVSNPAEFGRVAVLMGGWSTEREVSLWSGQRVLQALRARGIDAHGIDADRRTILLLGEAGFDRVFNLLHGTAGEDGTVQAVLDLHRLPYPGSGVLGSALAMDKLRSKRIWRAEGLPTPDYAPVAATAELRAAAERLGYPLFVKPAADGSSVGVVKVKRPQQCETAFAQARGEGRSVMAEAAVDGGGEFTCAILDGEALPLIRIEPDAEFYDYTAKYLSEQTRYLCPSGLDPAHEVRLRQLSLRAFELLGGRDWGRVDFMLDAHGEPWLLEVNTLPGMTAHSLVPMAALAAGIDFESLCWAILETSLSRTTGGGR